MARVTSQTTPEGDMVTGPSFQQKSDDLRQWFDVDGYLETLHAARPHGLLDPVPPPPADPPGWMGLYPPEPTPAENPPVGFITFDGEVDEDMARKIRVDGLTGLSTGFHYHPVRGRPERPEPSVETYKVGFEFTWWHLWGAVFFVIDVLIIGTMVANLLTQGRPPF